MAPQLQAQSSENFGSWTDLERFEAKRFRYQDSLHLDYRFMIPEDLRADTKYPLVVFLHGAGERGSDNTSQLKWGVRELANARRRTQYPAFIIAPQCPKDQRWVQVDWDAQTHTMPKEPSDPMKGVMAVIEHVLKEFPIDSSRIYVTGMSMGGFGTFDLIARKPEWFAAAAPVCGGADIQQLQHSAQIPLWIFHGALDPTVLVQRSRDVVNWYEKQGITLRYTEYPYVGHFAWNPAYATDELYEWMFSQTKLSP